MNFVFDPGLVLYLPLCELDGSSFMSRDAYGHLCTVTGALSRPNGYYFDGNDDYLAFPDTNLSTGTSDRTVIAWVKRTAGVSSDRIVTWGTWDTSKAFECCVNAAGKMVVVGYGDNYASAGAPVTESVWKCLAYILKDDTLYFYADAEEDSNFTSTLDTVLSGTAYVSSGLESTPSNVFLGDIGEIFIYSRALTPLEIQHNYLVTKWRYQ